MSNSSILSWSLFFQSQSDRTALQLLTKSIAYPWGNVSTFIYATAYVLLLRRSLQSEMSLDFLFHHNLFVTLGRKISNLCLKGLLSIGHIQGFILECNRLTLELFCFQPERLIFIWQK